MESGINKLIGVRELFRQSLSLYKTNYKVFMAIGLVPVVYGIIQGLVSAIFHYSMSDSILAVIIVSLVTILLGLLGIIIQTLYQVSLVKSIDDAGKSGAFDLKEVYRKSLSLFLSYWWVAILSGLIVIVCFVLFIVPGIIVSVLIGFAYFSLIIDGKKGLQALSNSYYYVKGNWLGVFGRLLSVSLISFILVIVIYAILFVLFALFMHTFDLAILLSKTEVMFGNYTVAGTIISLIGSIVIFCVYTPIICSFTFSIYKSLKTLKPEPNIDNHDLKTSRSWFKGLAIAGLVVGILMVLTPLIIGIIIGYKQAMNKIDVKIQPIERQVESKLFPEQAISLPIKMDSLEKAPYKNTTLGFSINLPKGWKASTDPDGVTVISPATKDIEMVINIDKKELPEKLFSVSDEALVGQIAGNILQYASTDLTNVSYSKYIISSKEAYVLGGVLNAKGQLIQVSYYFIRSGQSIYTISVSSMPKTWDTYSSVVINSINTFKMAE